MDDLKPLHKTFSFGKVALHGNRKINAVEVEIELKKVKGKDYSTLKGIEGYEFTASGSIWNNLHTDIESGGQNLDIIKELLPDNPVFNEIYELWTKYHLNSLKAGTKKQIDALKKEEFKTRQDGENIELADYLNRCVYLRSIKLYEDRGYEYGHEWLIMPIPKKDIKRIVKLCEFDNLQAE